MRLVFCPHERTEFQRHYLPAVSVCPEPEAVSLYTLHSQPQPCRSTWECTKVFTDIVSSVFMTTCRTGRVIPSWLVTMHQPGDFLQPYCPLLWSLGLGQGPVLVTVLDAGFEPSSRRVRSLRAVHGGGECAGHSPNDSRGVGSNSLREAWRAAVPFLLVRVEAGLVKTWKHQSERRLDDPAIRNKGKGRGLVWGDPVQGLLLGSYGALSKPLHHSELRCHGVYCTVMVRPHHSMECHFLQGQVTANVTPNQLVMVIDPRTSLSTDEKNLDTPFSSVLLRERLGKLLPFSGSQSSHLLRQVCKYHPLLRRKSALGSIMSLKCCERRNASRWN